MNLVEIKNLSFGYSNQKKVLKNISFNIEKGKFVCIIGENGSGKSTLVKCIVGLIKNYTGEIRKTKYIGYLPQKNEIQSNFPATIEEIVLSGTISKHPNSIFYTKEDKKTAKDIMEKLNIYKIRKTCFADLSGGQQQRVLIARALCATEEIIILDEPTNGLDPNIATQIYELLDELKKKDNLTIFMVSHDTERALKYTDKLIELTDGEVTYCGDVNN